MMRSRVTAIITVFNGENCIRDAIESLLKQTLSDTDILVINDGSTDCTEIELNKINDERLRVINLPRSGRARSLAFACNEATGVYIANLDADDISYPERLEKQMLFLDEHLDYAWVGCGEEREDDQRGERFQRFYPESDRMIRRQSSKCIPYCHSGIMFRKSLIDEDINYDSEQLFLIDFEFFIRVAQRYKVANLQEILVKRHTRDESYFQSQFTVTQQNFKLARLCARAVYNFNLPVYCYIYPLMRLIYPVIPNCIKRLIRKSHGLKELHD